MGPRRRADARLRNWVLEGGRSRQGGPTHPAPPPRPNPVLVFALGMLAGLALMVVMLAAVGVRGWR